MLHELLQFASENPLLAIIFLGVAAGTIVGVCKYIAYAIKGDPNIIANGDDNE